MESTDADETDRRALHTATLLPDGRVLVTGGEDLIIRRALVASRGREVKHTGDGIMASFDDVANALECAAAIQDGFDARTPGGGTPELRVRIGMAAGEPVDHNDECSDRR